MYRVMAARLGLYGVGLGWAGLGRAAPSQTPGVGPGFVTGGGLGPRQLYSLEIGFFCNVTGKEFQEHTCRRILNSSGKIY